MVHAGDVVGVDQDRGGGVMEHAGWMWERLRCRTGRACRQRGETEQASRVTSKFLVGAAGRCWEMPPLR